ncbi:transmembrane protein 81 isoform 1-T1 [Synchiropus picturatus]
MFCQRQVLELWIVFLFYHNLDACKLEELSLEAVVNSTPCSVTCGVGIQTKTLCFLKNGTITSEQECRLKKMVCLRSAKCGISTVTVTVGERVDIDCIGEVRELMEDLSLRVEWRHVRGLISIDDSLFAHWNASQKDRLILDPVREADAGTYRCLVLNSESRRVKRMYWGVRVVPNGFINLDYKSAVAQWESGSLPDSPGHTMTTLDQVMSACGIAAALTMLISLVFYSIQRCWDIIQQRCSTHSPAQDSLQPASLSRAINSHHLRFNAWLLGLVYKISGSKGAFYLFIYFIMKRL